jgi:hypothetical protein
LFSAHFLQDFNTCDNPHQLAELLVQAFQDCSQQDGPACPEMALFVMELAVNSVVRHVKQKTQEELEQRVTKLKSTKGKLLNFIRHISE